MGIETAGVPAAREGRELRYDKGERRHKHSGRSASASVDAGNPKKVVGKCPNNILQPKREELLQTAIPGQPLDPTLGFHKHLYLTYLGAIYECATSDFGTTYHAYPYHGPMLRSLKESLQSGDDARLYASEFEGWVRDHVKVRG